MYNWIKFSWDDVIREYSMGYHNIYLREYMDGLQEEFNDEDNPISDFQMHKIFARIKRNADRRYQLW